LNFEQLKIISVYQNLDHTTTTLTNYQLSFVTSSLYTTIAINKKKSLCKYDAR